MLQCGLICIYPFLEFSQVIKPVALCFLLILARFSVISYLSTCFSLAITLFLWSYPFQCWHLLIVFSFKVKVRFPRFLFDEKNLDILGIMLLYNLLFLTGSHWHWSSRWRESATSWLPGLGRNLASFPSVNTWERLLSLLGKLEIPAYPLGICWYHSAWED